MFSPEDLNQIEEKGLTLDGIETQLAFFRNGIPKLPVKGAAVVNDGIRSVGEEQVDYFQEVFFRYLTMGKVVEKFVPASGAATRMFKDLYTYLIDGEETDAIKEFRENLTNFPFYAELEKELQSKGIDIKTAPLKKWIELLIEETGLNYGNLPKGLLSFHKYKDEVRTPVGEHLIEGVSYARQQNNEVKLHFTVSNQHLDLFKSLIENRSTKYAQRLGVKYNISFSEQKPSTETIAVDDKNIPFRDEEGKILFRPGGHGALIENLNDLESDIVFIKNIDNVIPDRLKEHTNRSFRLLGGMLVDLQQRINNNLGWLKKDAFLESPEKLKKLIYFIKNDLSLVFPDSFDDLSPEEQVVFLKAKLDRPIRVCGMVENTGEPGGGPYWVENPDGTKSLQILEMAQLDTTDEEVKVMVGKSTHFNPVFIACMLRDFDGKKYNLLDYVYDDTAFISHKSVSGKSIKALELPGLWNGAMADWITVFVEVPMEVFNPVKTVNDLLRPEHKPKH